MRLLFLLFLSVSLQGFTQNDSVQTIPAETKDTFEYFTMADTNDVAYRLPAAFTKPQTWKKRDMERMGPLGNSYLVTYTDSMDLKKALQILDREKDFYQVCAAKSWCNNHYKEAFPYLIARLSKKEKIGLTNSADLIIWARIQSGDMKFYGHGGGLNGEYDIFTSAGRASWILNDLTGEKFAVATVNMSKAEAAHYKMLWKEYLDKLK